MKLVPSIEKYMTRVLKFIEYDQTKFLLILFGFLLLASSGMAQDPGFGHNARFEDRWRQDGQFLMVQITKASPTRIYVLGREEAKIDFSKLKITVRRAKPYPGKILKLNRFNNYYEVNDPKDFNQATHLEVTTQFDNKKETLHFNLHQDKSEK